MKIKTILMLGVIGIGAAANAAVISATQNGQINASTTWGGATLPTAGNADTWDTDGNTIAFVSETFHGGLLNVTGGSLLEGNAGATALNLQATTFDGGGIRNRLNGVDTVNFSGKALTFGSGGAAFISNNNNRNIKLQNGVWAGSGAISYAKVATLGALSRLILDTDNTLSGYTGIISVNNTSGIGTARLSIGSATTGSFGVDIGAGSVLDAIDMTLSSLVLGGETIAADTYAYGDFTVAQQAFLFDGGGEITVIPEPATLGLITAFGGAMLFVRRRLTIRRGV